jgi:hypothetical protein
MTEDQEPQLPDGCKWVKASDLKPGDKIALDDGSFQSVAKIRKATWIRTAEGPCLEIFAHRNDSGGFLLGKSDEVPVKA